jgi:hypothetical protein
MSKVSSKEVNYNELISYYEQNKDKPWYTWLSFSELFTKPGKQGIVGLLQLKDIDHKYVFKISQYINYLVNHETIVMKGLNDISKFCPHFCKSIGTITAEIEPKVKESSNPFNVKSKYPIRTEVLLSEYIDNSCKFYNYIRSDKIHEDVLYSTIKQVLIGISIAQKKKSFSHYDLHSFNVMMKRCNKDVVFLYALDEENQFCIPTLGHYPVIIDFGFSYISDMEDGPLWASMAHTDVGFMSDRFDWVADPKLFLVTVSEEIKNKRKTKKAKRLRRIVKNIFYPLNIDWESGWDDLEDKGALDYVLNMVKEYNTSSQLFEEYDHYCMDLIQSLIILPIEEQSYTNINKSYTAWLKEWVKIENEISNPFYNLYILKGVIDAARNARSYYMLKSTSAIAIKMFKDQIYERLGQVSKFCIPKNINFEKMLCSLLVFSRNVEGILYDVITPRMYDKQKEYNKMPLQSTEQIYGAISANIQDKYVYNKKTRVFIFDSTSETCDIFTIPEDKIMNVNDTHSMARGTFIYDMYRNK